MTSPERVQSAEGQTRLVRHFQDRYVTLLNTFHASILNAGFLTCIVRLETMPLDGPISGTRIIVNSGIGDNRPQHWLT